jgi:hypothetical protein
VFFKFNVFGVGEAAHMGESLSLVWFSFFQLTLWKNLHLAWPARHIVKLTIQAYNDFTDISDMMLYTYDNECRSVKYWGGGGYVSTYLQEFE